MRKICLYVLIFVLVTLSIILPIGATSYSITNCTDLNNTRNDLSGNYTLTADINFSSAGCTQFQSGAGFVPIPTFTGSFDGGNHTISNIIIKPASGWAGLFAQFCGTFKNVKISNPDIRGNSEPAAAVMGYNDCLVNINNVVVSGGYISSNTHRVACIIGSNDGNSVDTISNVRCVDTILSNTGTLGLGGIIGFNYPANTFINTSYVNVTMNSTGTNGGLVGKSTNAPTIYNSFVISKWTQSGGDAISSTAVTTSSSNKNYYDPQLTQRTTAISNCDPVNSTASASIGHWTNTTKYNNIPMNTWNTNIWVLNQTGLPILTMELEPVTPPTYPQWANLFWNGTSPIEIGSKIYTRSNWSDSVNLSSTTIRYFNTTHWINSVTPINFGANCLVYNTVCTSPLYSLTLNRVGVWQWQHNATNINGYWNITLAENITVVDTISPQYTSYGFNVSSPIYINTPIEYKSNWTDNGGFSSAIMQTTNSTHTISNASFSLSSYSCDTTCNISGLVAVIGTPGNYTYKLFVNDTSNNWNSTPYLTMQVLPLNLYNTSIGNVTFTGSDNFVKTKVLNVTSWNETGLVNHLGRTYPELYSDIDNDGLLEFIFFTPEYVRIYRNNALDLIYTFEINGTGSTSNPIIVANWTSPNTNSILLINENANNPILNVFTIEENGIDWYAEYFSLNTTFVGYRGGQIALGCGQTSCLIAYNQLNYSGYAINTSVPAVPNTTSALYVLGFFRENTSQYMNSTYNIQTPYMLNNQSNTSCFPLYRDLQFIDYDYDGIGEWIFSTITINGGASDKELITNYVLYNNNTINIEKQFYNTDINNPVRKTSSPDYKIKCYYDSTVGKQYSGVSNYVTNPILYDSNNNNLSEYYQAIYTGDYDTTETDNDFKIMSYGFGTSTWTDVADIFGDKGIMGNLFLGYTDQSYLCSMGYRETGSGIMCGNINNSDEEWFDNDVETPYAWDYSTMVHSIGTPNDYVSYRGGLSWLDDTLFGGDMITIWATSSLTNEYLVPVPDLYGYSDFLISDLNNFYYYDDMAVDGPAQIDGWNIDPCIASTYNTCDQQYVDRVSWNLGSQIELKVNFSDTNYLTDDNNVSITIYWYVDSDNASAPELSYTLAGWIVSPATVTYNFSNILNWTTSNSTFIIDVFDQTNGTHTNYSDYFSVVPFGGVSFRNCLTCNGYSTEKPSVSEPSLFIQSWDSFKQIINLPGNIAWLLVILTAVGVIWWQMYHSPWIAGLVSGGVVLILAMIGASFKFISGGIFFIIMLFLIAGTVLAIYSKMRHN
jgi:hypothetical protein